MQANNFKQFVGLVSPLLAMILNAIFDKTMVNLDVFKYS